MILVPAISPAGNWPEPDLIGAKMTKIAKNGIETGLKRVETGIFHFKLVENLNGHVLEV